MPLSKETQERREQETPPEVVGRKLLTHGDQALRGYRDQSSVSAPKRKELDIQPHEALYWAQRPDFYEQHTGSNRVDELAESVDARVPVNKDGKPHTWKDLILCAYPQEIKEANEKADWQRAQEYLGEIEEEAHEGHFNPAGLTKEEKQRRMESASRENRRAGILGSSRTSGLSYGQARSLFSDEDVRRDESEARTGPTRHTFDDEEWARQIDWSSQGGNATKSSKSKSTLTFGGFQKSGFPGTTPTAQARATAKSGKAA